MHFFWYTKFKRSVSSPSNSTFTNSEWELIFKTRGIIAKTEILEPNHENLNRKAELLRWFTKRLIKESFVIIDDDKSVNDLPEYIRSRAIVTSGTVGLVSDQVVEAISILRSEEQTLA